MKILPLSPAPPPPGAPHREKTPPRNQVREEKRDHLLRREGGPGDDVLEPPECERISRFQPALDHFPVGKGEDTAGGGGGRGPLAAVPGTTLLGGATRLKAAPPRQENPRAGDQPGEKLRRGDRDV